MYSLWKKSKKTVSIADAKPIPWRLRPDFKVQEEIAVSIADAKPIPWRRLYLFTDDLAYFRFNRRREANPLATNDVSKLTEHLGSFNRRREANPLATISCRVAYR